MNTQLDEKDRKVLELIKAGMRRRGAPESEIAEMEREFINSNPDPAEFNIIDDSDLYQKPEVSGQKSEVGNPKSPASSGSAQGGKI